LPQVPDRRRRGAIDRRLGIGEQKHHFRSARAPQANLVAVNEHPIGDLLAIDVGAIAGIAVLQREAVPFDRDFGVIAGYLAAGEPQVVGFTSANLELALRDRDDAASESVGHFQAGIGHW
jgi:hypothetical protein